MSIVVWRNTRAILGAAFALASLPLSASGGEVRHCQPAVVLDGAPGNYLWAPSDRGLQDPLEFTIECWVLPEDVSRGWIVSKGDGQSKDGWFPHIVHLAPPSPRPAA